ncbi:membrane protein [Wenyingzhuangia marina]|nr:membrane protein [Wenyingzhuangia marina]
MMRIKNYTLFVILLIINIITTNAQKCNYSLSGVVIDSSNDKPIVGASIYLEGLNKGTISDFDGNFKIDSICEGNYHLDITHIGCENNQQFLEIHDNTKLRIVMNHFVQMLDGVHLLGHKAENTTQAAQNISSTNIQNNANENLSNLLGSLTGVSTLKNGSGIAKPVIHGMYGNRVTILNNGIVQNGQQWGNDHSPEIDPLIANNIKVIKGVGTLEYQGSTLGAVVLVTPKDISKDPHLHGATNYFFESNGLGNGLNLTLEKGAKSIAWKINGTLKKYGDRKTANYYLNNTGNNEANLAVQLRKQFSENWETKIYASTFNSELGVLRGSHISNLTDLTEALQKEVPFFTEDSFSYNIESPKQEVHHHLLKLLNTNKISDDEFYTFTYAGQLNIRKEFDIRRGGRSDIPALGLNQLTHFLEVKHQTKIGDDIEFKKGIQYTFTDNTNDSETGVLPLIPDYLSHQVGAFALLNKRINRWMYEAGARYNFTYQNVAAISKTTPRTIINFNNRFHNVNVSAGVRYRTLKQLHWAFNIGLASRNPAINELYSNGLHQGVSGIEEGNVNLKQENAIKTTLGLEGNIDQKWFFETLVYYQYIKDYIYLNPQDELRLTIRGAFPVFTYEQTNAQLFGLDVGTSYAFSDALKMGAKYSFLQGDNLSENIPLINMAANNALLTLDYHLPIENTFKNTSVGMEYHYVWKQNHLLTNQDYAPAPDAYQLLGFKFSTEKHFDKTKLYFYAKGNNLLNVAYRDYLNRLRYFANDTGRSITVGFRVSF